jgi:Flagellar assembly protein T, C-terminal domain
LIVAEVEAKVAGVLDSSRIALNAGSEQGVSEGDSVTLWRSVEVTDPDTNEGLGVVRLDKLRLVVGEVQPRLCVAAIRLQTNFGAMAIFGPSKKISTGRKTQSEDSVTVNPGDAATIYLADESADAN